MAELFDISTYDFQKAVDVLAIPETWTQVAHLITPHREAGVYVVGFSMTYDFDRTTNSVYARWRQQGGIWHEYAHEPKDITDQITDTYEFPAHYASIVHDVEVEMRKEEIQGTLNLRYLDVYVQRVGN